MGEDQGSYEYRGGGVYEYVSPGQGGYEPRIYLPLPERHFLSDLRLELNPSPSSKLIGELAISHHDRNTLSGRDDDENQDHAWFGSSGRSCLLQYTSPKYRYDCIVDSQIERQV